MQNLNFSTDPSHGRTTNPDMVLICDWVWMSPLPQWQYGPETPTWPSISDVYRHSMVTGALVYSIDPDFNRAMDPDKALSSSSGPDVTMTLSSNTDHSDVDAFWPLDTNLDSSGSFDPGHLHSPWWQKEPHMSV